MRSLRRSASPYDTFVDSLRPFLAKRLTECGGLILFAGAIALTVALATWSIDDPSLNHATDHRAHNVLGRPGAVVADLAMQLFGLGSIALALPPALWGMRLMRERDLPHGGFASCCGSSASSASLRWPAPCRRRHVGPCRPGSVVSRVTPCWRARGGSSARSRLWPVSSSPGSRS
ncbi:DNA translocase FtsK 4TM domain-containing protein [Methylorubrum suomiense]